MGEEVEMLDVNGRLVRVLVTVALEVIGRTMEDDDRLLVGHYVEGSTKYVEVRLERELYEETG